MADTTLDLSSLARAADLLQETDPFSSNAANNTPENDATLRLQSSAKPTSSEASDSDLKSSEVERDGEDSLKQERDALRAINDSLEAIFKNLSTAREKMQRFGTTVQTTHNLMNLYTRLLSQASHTQQLLLDGEWEQAVDITRAREEEEAERKRLMEETRAAQAEQERAEREERQREDARRIRDNSGMTGAVRGTRIAGTTRTRVGTSMVGGGRAPPPAVVCPGSSAPNDTGAGRTASLGRASAQVTGVRGQRGLRSRGRGRPPE